MSDKRRVSKAFFRVTEAEHGLSKRHRPTFFGAICWN